MPTIRERLAGVLLGQEREQLRGMVRDLKEAYLGGPFIMPPDKLIEQLKEYDSATVMDLVAQLGYDYLGSMSGYAQVTEAERLRAINESNRQWRYSPLAQWTVQTWTNFGVGESIAIKCDDENADEVWQEAWKAERNANLFGADHIHELSNWVLIEGNIFLAVFASTLDGTVTVNELPVSEIAEIITNPNNASEPLFYKRVFSDGTGIQNKTRYYPDWQVYFSEDFDAKVAKLKIIPADAERADKENDLTPVCVIHIAHNRKVRGSLWGWPILSIGVPWMRAHKEFMENRLTVSAAKAMYVRKTKITGGSRALASVRNKLRSTLSASNSVETNPSAAAGSTFLENQMADTTDMPMTTGASDAETDNKMFTWMALIAGGLFPTSAGLDTSRWATALAMDKTQSMQWSRYQTFWGEQFKKIVAATLLYAEKYPGTRTFDSKEAQISIDSFSLVDFPEVTAALSDMISMGLIPLVETGVVPSQTVAKISQSAWRVALKALGIDNDDLTSDETWGINAISPAEARKQFTNVMSEIQKRLNAESN